MSRLTRKNKEERKLERDPRGYDRANLRENFYRRVSSRSFAIVILFAIVTKERRRIQDRERSSKDSLRHAVLLTLPKITCVFRTGCSVLCVRERTHHRTRFSQTHRLLRASFHFSFSPFSLPLFRPRFNLQSFFSGNSSGLRARRDKRNRC